MFNNLIAQNQRVYDFAILDLVITDEFNEPFHYVSTPIKIEKKNLFENELRMDSNLEGTEVMSIDYQGEHVGLKMELVYKEDENMTYVTQCLVKIDLSRINNHFGTNY